MTPERMAILSEILSIGSHFDVEQIHSALEAKGYHVSRGTAYKTVDLLCQCGIVRRLVFTPLHSYYEVAGRSHLHLVCTECGRVREIDLSQGLPTIPSNKLGGFSVDYSSTILYGLCSRCSRKSRAASK